MNTNTEQTEPTEKRKYEATIITTNPAVSEKIPEAVQTAGQYIAKKVVEAKSRAGAVTKIKRWIYGNFDGALGKLHVILTVADPSTEVRYSPAFKCGVVGNRFLDEVTIERVLAEANGELVRDTREGDEHHPPCSVIRAKRRRCFPKKILPCIVHKKNLTGRGWHFAYRLIQAPQVTENGVVVSRRKVKLVPLAARTLEQAVREVEARGLHRRNKESAKRFVKVRSLKFLKHITGMDPLTRQDDLAYFGDALARYTNA
ncbi:MAG: hypothetical protein Q7R64_02270 [bacterium]|nr:hypothetical protein [bacterium]